MSLIQIGILIISILVVILIVLIGVYFLLYYHKYPPIYLRSLLFASFYAKSGFNKKASKYFTVLHRRHPEKLKYIKSLAKLYFKLESFDFSNNYLNLIFEKELSPDSEFYYMSVLTSYELLNNKEVIQGTKKYFDAPNQSLRKKLEILKIAIEISEDEERIEDLILFLEHLSEISENPLPVLEKIVKYSLYNKDPIKALENLYVMNKYVKDDEHRDTMLSYADNIQRLNPGTDEVIRFMGIILTEKKDFTAASFRFKAIINAETDDMELIEYSIIAYLGAELKSEALFSLNLLFKMLETQHEKIELLKKMEALAYELSDEDSLLNIYMYWFNLDELPLIQSKRLATILLRRERIPEAIDILKAILEKENDDLGNYQILFDIYFDSEDKVGMKEILSFFKQNLPKMAEERLELINKFISLYPDELDVLMELVEIYRECGDIENKVKYLEMMMQYIAGDKKRYLYELGEDFIQLERYADAINIYVRLNELDENNLEILYKLAKLYNLIDRPEIGFEVYLEILNNFDEERKAFNKIIDIIYHFQKAEDYLKSLELLFEVIKLFPDDPALFEKLGDIYTDMGRVDDAKKSYLKVVELDSSRYYISEKLNRLNLIIEESEIITLREKISKLRGLKSDTLQEEKHSLELQLASKLLDVGKMKQALELYILIYKRGLKGITRAKGLAGLLNVSIKLKKFNFAKDFLKDGIELDNIDVNIKLSVLYYAFIVYEHLDDSMKCNQLGIEILSHDPEYKDIKKRLKIIN